MATIKNAPAASRRWLTYGAVVLLLVIASGLIYRQFAGTTIREQRVEREKEKAAQELAAKAPADANGFSAKLMEQFKRGQAEVPSQAATAVGAPLSTVNSNSEARSAPVESDLVPLPSQEQDAQYEERRARLQLDQSRRIGVWEAGAGAHGLGGPQQPASPIDGLIAAARSHATQGAAQPEPPPTGTSALEELARRYSQAGGTTGVAGAGTGSAGAGAKDEQFTAAAGQRPEHQKPSRAATRKARLWAL